MEGNSSAQHEKEKQSLLVEVSDIEKQLWALVGSKGLLQPEVQNLYHQVCSSYERVILKNLDIVNYQEVEYSLWKLHYKHIDEFRRQIKKGSAGSPIHVEGLTLFLLDATEFYKSLLLKLQSQSTSKVHIEHNLASQFLCHRFLICLGDLARYRELFEKTDVEARNWSVAAGHYLEASKIWPESGNPHNQLALLATYISDEFLALYHCVRSLAIKEPFPDAWNNLLHLLEKSRSSPLSLEYSEAPFNFLRPLERIVPSKGKILKGGQNCSVRSNLWPLIVRTASFFYIKSSFEDFPGTFASTIRELEMLMELDDSKLENALRSYQFTDTMDTGPTHAVQAVCTFIFIIHNLSENPLLQNLEETKGGHHQLFRERILSSIFIFVGRLVDRCLKAHSVDSCPLLPSILVFMEWLVSVPNAQELPGSSEEERAAVSYFFMSLVHLLNSLKTGRPELGSRDCAALWEDFKLRGFAPLAKSHSSLDFSTSSSYSNSFQSGNTFRAWRILSAAKKIAGRYPKWVCYDKSSLRFSATAKAEDKPVNVDEEEVILFKPLIRYNSAPLYDCITSKGQTLEEEDSDKSVGASDECLRRTQTSLEFKLFKQPESAVSAGPPSLSAWVLNGGSSGIGKENHLSPIEELASTSLDNLLIRTSKQEDPIRDSSHQSVIAHYPFPPPPPPYSAPVPSAPLLPEDAAWFSGNNPNFLDGATGRISDASPGFSYPKFHPQSCAGFVNLAYPVSCGLSSSEWLRKFREINSLHPGNNQMWSPHLLRNFDTLAGPAPLDANQMVYSSPKPLSYPEFYQKPMPPYGCNGLVVNPARDDQLSLLQHLKEREWRLQQDPSLRGPAFLGK